MFKKRQLLIATKHGKEAVIEPLFRKEFKINSFTSKLFDTDILGTFSGEISRKDDALTTLRKKCILGHEATNCDLVIANEGSFGQHPTLFFTAADEEWVMLKDFRNDLEIVAREITFETNFNGQSISSVAELLEFSEKVHFSTHGIILKSGGRNPIKIVKDNYSKATLLHNYSKLKQEYDTVFAETDMRAHRNPTRMKVIEKVTQNLIKKIKNCCPSCRIPGFDVVYVKPGLPCENCLYPTKSTLSHLYQCKKCKFQQEKIFPRGIKLEDATYCDFCNP